jgi:hypothetical protein
MRSSRRGVDRALLPLARVDAADSDLATGLLTSDRDRRSVSARHLARGRAMQVKVGTFNLDTPVLGDSTSRPMSPGAAQIIDTEMRLNSAFLIVGDMNDPPNSGFVAPLIDSVAR